MIASFLPQLSSLACDPLGCLPAPSFHSPITCIKEQAAIIQSLICLVAYYNPHLFYLAPELA